MQLYFKPPGHLPGRYLFQGKRIFIGITACALVTMFTVLPVRPVSAETVNATTNTTASQKPASKPSTSKKPTSSKTASNKSASTKSANKQSANKKVAVNKHPHEHHRRDDTYMKRKWGVEVMYVRETSAGYMLEFRYKVLDAEKAKPLFERQTKPNLTHVKSGAQLIVPTPAKTGALRNSNPPKDGKVYWMFFANPRKLVKAGEKVNIDIGDFHVNGLVVQK